MPSLLDHALDWANRGFKIFPLKPGEKTPVVKDWPHWATTDPILITDVWGNGTDYNIGVLCNGMDVIDVDVKNGKPGPESFAALGLPTDTLVVETPSGGLHYYYTGPSTSNTSGKLGPGIDTRSFNGYVIAPGSRLDGAERPYRLISDLPLAQLPEDVVARLDAPVLRLPGLSAAEADTPAALAEARDYLKEAPRAVQGAGGDHQTFVVAAMLRDFGVSETTALYMMGELWNEECSPPWSPEELEIKVSNAYRYGANVPGSKLPGKAFSPVELDESEKPKLPWFRRFTRAGDPVSLDNIWLFYNRIPYSGVAMIVAPSGAGKTFLLLKLAECLATGEPFFGVKPKERCASLILSSEGGRGFKLRMSSLAPGLPILSLDPPALGTPARILEMLEGIEAAIDEALLLHELRLGLIALDTMAASGMAKDEDDNSEMAEVVSRLASLAKKYDTLFVFTHHTTKDGSAYRGASAIFGGVDAMIFVHHEAKNPARGVEIMKNRDGWAGDWGSFTLETIDLGVDADGDTITTCTLSMGERIQRTIAKPPKHSEEFFRSFDAARVAHGLEKDAPVERDLLRGAFAKQIDVSSSAATKAFDRCLAWAQKALEVTSNFQEDGLFLMDQRPAVGDDDDG